MRPERINELVSQIDDFGGDPVVARKAIITAINETKEDCMRICANEMVSGETGTEGDEGYNQAITHCVEAILASKVKDIA